MKTGKDRSRPRCWVVAATLVAGLWAGAGRVAAQEVVADTIPADTVRADSTADQGRGLTPRGSMLRSLVVPGWGQASVGSYKRGAVFFGIRGVSAWMLVKTLGKLDDARSLESRLLGFATDSLNGVIAMDSLEAERLSDPLVYQAAIDSFPGLESSRGLIEARQQQRQDWIAYTIFFTLLDVVDAYVNAHFRDFPVSIDSEPTAGGGARFRLTVPLPGGGTARRPTPAGPAPPPGSRRR